MLPYCDEVLDKVLDRLKRGELHLSGIHATFYCFGCIVFAATELPESVSRKYYKKFHEYMLQYIPISLEQYADYPHKDGEVIEYVKVRSQIIEVYSSILRSLLCTKGDLPLGGARFLLELIQSVWEDETKVVRRLDAAVRALGLLTFAGGMELKNLLKEKYELWIRLFLEECRTPEKYEVTESQLVKSAKWVTGIFASLGMGDQIDNLGLSQVDALQMVLNEVDDEWCARQEEVVEQEERFQGGVAANNDASLSAIG